MRVTGIVKKIISHPIVGKAKLEIQDNSGGLRTFSEGSRYFDDLLMAICQVTSGEGRLYLSVNYFSSLTGGCAQRDYQNGTMTEFHKHNFTELAYVVEGGLHQDISGNTRCSMRVKSALWGRIVYTPSICILPIQ
jgi:hypothetical protein